MPLNPERSIQPTRIQARLSAALAAAGVRQPRVVEAIPDGATNVVDAVARAW
ncbi:MAG TPA: hypothetical protein VFG53_11655 [Anaeromyxobacter sp.]|nr:hypothetical protein [Anaeromyxobacter sp.]